MQKEDEYASFKILLEQKLSKKRYEHSLGVADMAAKLATLHSLDVKKAYLAGLMHDYAKNLPNDELLDIATKNNLLTDVVDIYAPNLLHACVGAFLLKEENIITDEEILQAISLHTTGSKDMTPFDAIIYVADYIEVGRKFANVEALRMVSYKSLEFGLLQCLDNSLAILISNGGLIHPYTVQARNAAIARINTLNYN